LPLDIHEINGPMRVLAGPGTGKTHALVDLYEQAVRERIAGRGEILVLTFSKSAAGEISRRIDDRLHDEYGEAWISTFHSFCARLLREHAPDRARAVERRPRAAQQFGARGFGNGSALQLLAPGVDKPHALLLAELGSKVDTVSGGLDSHHLIWSPAKRHFGRWTAPGLILELAPIDADPFIELRDEAVRVRNRKKCRALMRDQPVPVHVEFVTLGLATEDRMVIEDDTALARTRAATEEHGRSETADAAADHNQIVRLTGVDRLTGAAPERPVTDGVRHFVRPWVATAHATQSGRVVSGRVLRAQHGITRVLR